MTGEPIDGLVQLVARNDAATEETIAHAIGELLIKCIVDLDECGIERPEQLSTVLAADIASNAVTHWHSKGAPDDTAEFRKLQLAAKLLNALALLESVSQPKAQNSDAFAPRLVQTAWLVGNQECVREFVKLGYLDGYAEKKFSSGRASEHAKSNAQSRRAKAEDWKSRAIVEFRSRPNHKMSAEAWAAAHFQEYEVKAGTLAKALQKAGSDK